MKYTLVLLALFAFGYAQSQIAANPAAVGPAAIGPAAAFGGLSPGQFFQNVVLNAEAGKLLVDPNFPDDLRLRVQDAMANAQPRFDGCATTAVLPWLQIRCSAMQLQIAKAELKSIENEALARAQAAAAAAAASSPAPAPVAV